MNNTSGFTLAELMIAVVVIGLLAVIAIPRLAYVKERAYASAMKSDLHNLATLQESYFYDQSAYTADLAVLNTRGFQTSEAVTVTIAEATPTGWSAQATHSAAAGECALYVGTAAPVGAATAEGAIACQ